MNWILAKQTDKMPFHTLLGPLIDSFNGQQERYNWLITDYEAYFGPFWDGNRSGGTPQFFTGSELTKLASEFSNEQLIWGVLTAIPKSVRLGLKRLPIEPVANGGTTFWEDSPKFQFPNAIAEIVAWDSSFTILVTRDIELSKEFHAFFPESVGLDEFNREHNSKSKNN